MNKIIFQFGLLMFFFSIIYFTQKGDSLQQIVLNSFTIFIILTVMLSLLSIMLIRSINKNSFDKINSYSEDLAGTNKNE
ncbi:hypothetical protein APF79_13130 [bacterium BRH_c32]|nr:MAG: hypothetical protein APF79_13130 [bacterium BRH_c32]